MYTSASGLQNRWLVAARPVQGRSSRLSKQPSSPNTVVPCVLLLHTGCVTAILSRCLPLASCCSKRNDEARCVQAQDRHFCTLVRVQAHRARISAKQRRCGGLRQMCVFYKWAAAGKLFLGGRSAAGHRGGLLGTPQLLRTVLPLLHLFSGLLHCLRQPVLHSVIASQHGSLSIDWS